MRDSTGAGDLFAAGLLHALRHGYPMAQALAHANHGGEIAVRHPGSEPPANFAEEILRL